MTSPLATSTLSIQIVVLKYYFLLKETRLRVRKAWNILSYYIEMLLDIKTSAGMSKGLKSQLKVFLTGQS